MKNLPNVFKEIFEFRQENTYSGVDVTYKRLGVVCPICNSHLLENTLEMGNNVFYRANIDIEERMKYILTGVPRSGSTIFFQIINELTGQSDSNKLSKDSFTLKTHVLETQDCFLSFCYDNIFLTTRHPYDVYISLLQLCGHTKPENWTIETIIKEGYINHKMTTGSFKNSVDIIKSYDFLSNIYKDCYNPETNKKIIPDLTILRYENFKNNLDRINVLKKSLDIKVSKDREKKISELLSIENNHARKESEYFLRENHVSNTMGSSNKHKVDKTFKTFIYEMYKDYFETFNYEQ